MTVLSKQWFVFAVGSAAAAAAGGGGGGGGGGGWVGRFLLWSWGAQSPMHTRQLLSL